MASQSAHFNLTKPASTDYYSLTVVNNNTDIIDTQMYNNQVSAAKVMVGATANEDGESGRVPAPTSADRTKYLKGDGTWDTPQGGGGSNVVPNPTGTPTDTLDTISIDGTIYEIQGSGGGGTYADVDLLWEYTDTFDITLAHPFTDYDFLVFEGYNYSDAYHVGGAIVSSAQLEDIIGSGQMRYTFNGAIGEFANYWVASTTSITRSNEGNANVLKVWGIKYMNVTSLDFSQLTAQQIYDLKRSLGLSDVEVYDYAEFDGSGYFTTPFTIDSDYTIEVTFDATYKSPSSVYGNMDSSGYSHLTMYNNRWYMSSGSVEVNPIAYTSGKHTFISNSNGKNYMDNVDVSTYTPTSYNTEYVIGNRYQSATYEGKFYEFKLTSISTGDVICDIVPAMKGSDIGLYDKVTGLFTKCTYISSVANDAS